MEFKVNEIVVHCREGLSTIVGETEIAGNPYFVIVSRKNPKENIYVLKSRTENIIRPVMNRSARGFVYSFFHCAIDLLSHANPATCITS